MVAETGRLANQTVQEKLTKQANGGVRCLGSSGKSEGLGIQSPALWLMRVANPFPFLRPMWEVSEVVSKASSIFNILS